MQRRGVAVGLILLSVLAVGLDLMRSPSAQVTAKLLLTTIDLYQATLSRALGSAGAKCRFTPTCSHYGEAVIRRYGALKGSWLAVKRIFRCGPWTPMGTEDPAPGEGSPPPRPTDTRLGASQ